MWPVLCAYAAVLALGYGAGVPLYDGVGFPDEPYRYVSPPPGVKHGPSPQPVVSESSPVADGVNQRALAPQGNEQAPQILLSVPAGSLRTATAREVTVAVRPLAPDVQPQDGTVDGNVYRVALVARPPGAVQLVASSKGGLYMRATSIRPAVPEFEYRAAATGPWRRLPTRRTANDVFATDFVGAGDYALVHLRGAKADPRTVSGETVSLLVLAGVVLATVVLMLVARQPWRPVAPRGPGSREDVS